MHDQVMTVNNVRSAPKWMGDFISGREMLEPFPAKIDPYQFSDANGTKVIVGAAGAAGNATTFPVDSPGLPGPLPKGAVLAFGAANSKKFAKLTQAEVAGATTIHVENLATALVSGDTAVFSPTGRITIPSGTYIGRTLAERDAGTGFGPAAITDDERYLLAFAIEDALTNNDAELYRHTFAVKENFLPDWATLNVAVNEVQTVTIAGSLSAGIFVLTNPRTGQETTLAYNGNLAAIQTALDAIYGATNTVAAGTIASFTITFAVALAGIDMPLINVQPDGVTGLTGITVVETTKGGKALLTVLRQDYNCYTGVN